MKILGEDLFEGQAVLYGQYVATERNPSKQIIREAKLMLIEGIKRTQTATGKRATKIQFIINPEYEMIDPETYAVEIVGTVWWKAFFE